MGGALRLGAAVVRLLDKAGAEQGTGARASETRWLSASAAAVCVGSGRFPALAVEVEALRASERGEGFGRGDWWSGENFARGGIGGGITVRSCACRGLVRCVSPGGVLFRRADARARGRRGVELGFYSWGSSRLAGRGLGDAAIGFWGGNSLHELCVRGGDEGACQGGDGHLEF